MRGIAHPVPVRRRSLTLMIVAMTIIVLLLALSGCEGGERGQMTLGNDSKTVATVTVSHFSADPSEFSIVMKNESDKKALLSFTVFSVKPDGTKTKKKVVGAATVNKNKSTKTVKFTPNKGECVRVEAKFKTGKSSVNGAKTFNGACWRSPMDA